ncbi:hypothetical protein [Solitalea lacus]|uniref:hypothetical protein n=1 Tax=Solitalea lacus TaxID=2911172 RepID=UPI001EDB02C4|nr:hypothetical protein [Solitalea lacus]UKJ06711.1 hypothetical protein L2B55_14380 [Solitalea lacus]
MEIIPYKISEYIKEHFREDFLSEIKKVKNASGKTLYLAEITQNNLTYHLMFNEKGVIVNEEADPNFPQDDHEGLSFDEGFHPDENNKDV